jgi:Kef-type K+ transport system membrane component KefB
MTDAELAKLFLSLVLLLSAALGGGHLFERLRLPRVIGEICGGLVLGPSVLGLVVPGAYSWVFQGFSAQPALLSAFYWLGLILLMFTAGFRVEPTVGRRDRYVILLLVVGSSLLPVGFGWLIAPYFPAAAGADPLAFTLVMAIACAVTSIPVISRIFIDLGMIESRFAKLTISAATVQDLMLWVTLAIATAIQQGGGTDLGSLGRVVAVTVAFAAGTLLLGPALLRFAGRLTVRRFTDASLTGYTLLVCLIFVTLASLLHVNIIFGALLAGLIIGRFPADRFAAVKQRIADIALWFFVPIYFAQVGLLLNLPAQFDAGLILGFLAASSVVKIVSVVLTVKLARISWLDALDHGIAMNTRGGPGIVLASVAHASGIIGDPMFVALVLASILTSLLSGMWFRWRLHTGTSFPRHVA